MLSIKIDKEDQEEMQNIMDIIGPNITPDIVEIKSLSGQEYIQIILQISSILIPVISQIIQKYYDNNKVTIKLDKIDINVIGYKKALALLEEINNDLEDSK